MTSVLLDKAKLFYEARGSGQPLIFIHGVLNDYRCWKYQIQALSGRYRTIAYSRRYAWPNQTTADLTTQQRVEVPNTIQSQVADLENLIDKLGASPAHLVGHSGGGVIACDFATQHPEKIRSLILVDPGVATMLVRYPITPLSAVSFFLQHPFLAASAAKVQRRYKAATKALDAGDLGQAANLFRTDPNAPKLGEEFEKMRVDNARTLREGGADLPQFTRREAEKIKNPTLVINGENSSKLFFKITEKLTETMPNCESVVISRGGHNCFVENPEEFNSRLSEFLSKHS